MKTINIKGKEYVPVNERVKEFRNTHNGWSLTSEIISFDDTSVIVKATICDENGCIKATGLAQEFRSSSTINKTSFVENCETSAWGRALGNLGIGIDASMASADEMQDAITKQETLNKKVEKSAVQALRSKAIMKGVEEEKICTAFNVDSFENLTEEQWLSAMRRLDNN